MGKSRAYSFAVAAASGVGDYTAFVDLRRAPAVPRWFVIPQAASSSFGALYAVWAFVKFVGAMVPRMQCGGPEPATVRMAVTAGVIEGAIGIAVAGRRGWVRHSAALAGTGLNVGLIGFAAVASARGVETKGCGCFGGLDLPWSVHAAIAAALAAVFFAILLDFERRLAAP